MDEKVIIKAISYSNILKIYTQQMKEYIKGLFVLLIQLTPQLIKLLIVAFAITLPFQVLDYADHKFPDWGKALNFTGSFGYRLSLIICIGTIFPILYQAYRKLKGYPIGSKYISFLFKSNAKTIFEDIYTSTGILIVFYILGILFYALWVYFFPMLTLENLITYFSK